MLFLEIISYVILGLLHRVNALAAQEPIQGSVPHVDIQSVFVEAWESKSPKDPSFKEITGHTIVINAGWKQPESGIIVPLKSYDTITLQTRSEDLPMLMATSNDGIQRKYLKKKQAYTFPLNEAGRFSFTVPIEGKHASNLHLRLPELLVRTNYMPADQWYDNLK